MNVFIASAGTAGHINAALALGEKLESKNTKVIYFTGKRHLDLKLHAHLKHVHYLPSATIRGKNPLALMKSALLNFYCLIKVLFLALKYKPCFAFGAGGYVCGPVLFATWINFKPIYIIEQNSVMGLTNKLLAPFCKKIFFHFKQTRYPSYLKKKVHVVGNPTRSAILESINQNEGNKVDIHKLKKTVFFFGGSLGAKGINDFLASLSQEQHIFDNQTNLTIIHQFGKQGKFLDFSKHAHIAYQGHEFVDNIHSIYKESDLIVCRAGASTISELRYIQKPCILIPYPFATDNHQKHNALAFKDEFNELVDVVLQGSDSQKFYHDLKSIIDVKLSQNNAKESSQRKSVLDACEQIVMHLFNKNL